MINRGHSFSAEHSIVKTMLQFTAFSPAKLVWFEERAYYLLFWWLHQIPALKQLCLFCVALSPSPTVCFDETCICWQRKCDRVRRAIKGRGERFLKAVLTSFLARTIESLWFMIYDSLAGNAAGAGETVLTSLLNRQLWPRVHAHTLFPH